jgi:hypothetical protein
MNWARAKTLLIVLLLIVNATLGGILFFREWQTAAQDARALEELCAILENNGLTVRPEQIPPGTALTFDIEAAPGEDEPAAGRRIRGLNVWGQVSGSLRHGISIVPLTGSWDWEGALPIDNRASFSAGFCLLKLTADWEETGVLEHAELGFAASPIAPNVMRLRPYWLFVISGEEVFYPAY